MLYKETVKGETFQLLIDLMQDERLKDFNLAGGTALALYLGHRISIDLDLFTSESFNAKELESHLINQYNFKSDFLEKNTLKGTINNVKIDCITHAYPYLKKPVTTKEGIRLYSIEDIAAMKLSAITDNGTRLKDFIDISFLSTKLSFAEMLNAYKNKFANVNPIGPMRALTYYNDINFKEPIQIIGGKYEWKLIDKRLHSMINNENCLFKEFPIMAENEKQIISDIIITCPSEDKFKIRCKINGRQQLSEKISPKDCREILKAMQSNNIENMEELKLQLAKKYFHDQLEHTRKSSLKR